MIQPELSEWLRQGDGFKRLINKRGKELNKAAWLTATYLCVVISYAAFYWLTRLLKEIAVYSNTKIVTLGEPVFQAII